MPEPFGSNRMGFDAFTSAGDIQIVHGASFNSVPGPAVGAGTAGSCDCKRRSACVVAQEAEGRCGVTKLQHRLHRRRRELRAALIDEAKLRKLGSNITQRALMPLSVNAAEAASLIISSPPFVNAWEDFRYAIAAMVGFIAGWMIFQAKRQIERRRGKWISRTATAPASHQLLPKFSTSVTTALAPWRCPITPSHRRAA